jgi:tRNA threonylcarbamoyladenosine biosynthesis protein TsaE
MPDARVLTEAELRAEGERLGRQIPPRSVLWLQGDLGAGKTALARAVVSGLGGGDVASSPTYALVHHYHGSRGPVYHVDCYRLRSADEAADLDWETLAGADTLLVEWPERAGPWVPAPTLRLRLSHVPDPDRRALEVG